MPGPKKGARIRHRQWVQMAVKLSADGWSVRRIAEKIGVDHTQVWRALEEEFQRARPSDEEVAARRELMRERVERLLEKWTPKATNGDKDAALVVHRFLERLAKLDGVDAPVRSEVSGPDGGPVQYQNADPSDTILGKLAGLAARLAAGSGDPGANTG